MTAAHIRTWLLLIVGTATLVYALYPPIKPPYLSAAGGLLGFEPIWQSAK